MTVTVKAACSAHLPTQSTLRAFLTSFLLPLLISEGKEAAFLWNTCGLLLSLA